MILSETGVAVDGIRIIVQWYRITAETIEVWICIRIRSGYLTNSQSIFHKILKQKKQTNRQTNK